MMEPEIEVESDEFRPRFFVTLLIYMCEFNTDLKKILVTTVTFMIYNSKLT